MRLSSPVLALVLVLLAGRAASGETAGPRWSFHVRLTDLGRGVAEVRWTLAGFTGEVGLCADRAGVERHVRGLRQLGAGPGGERPLDRDPDDETCWRAAAASDGTLRLAYQYDLAGLARAHGDPDYASRIGDDYIFSDEGLLLRPDPLPRGAPIDVEFELPAGIEVSPPWRRLPGPGRRFRYDSDHYDAGSYIALGKLRSLGEIAAPGGTLSLVILDRPRRASDETLRAWVGGAARAVAAFYGGLPGGRVHVLLAPASGDDPGVFGTVLRRGPPSVVLYLGADAPEPSFPGDWVAPHELFHLGNPNVEGRPPWLIEGFTTYYQDVLRVRMGVRDAAATWEGLRERCQRFGDPEGGRSLAEESRRLHERHRYQRVYWGGACLALRLDVAIREAGRGARSLDEVLRALRRRSAAGRLSEDEVVATLDRAAGRALVRAHLDATSPLPFAELFRRLGVERDDRGGARLRDDAPLASLRRVMF